MRSFIQSLRYRIKLKKLPKNYCFFCNSKIKSVYKHWKITKCDFPYKKTKEHLLLFPYIHINFDKIKDEQFLELLKIFKKYYKKNYKIILNREKDCSQKEHLHFHLLLY